MPDFHSVMTKGTHLSDDEQRKVGKAIAGDMSEAHKRFAENVAKLLESNAIDVDKPESLLHFPIYETLGPEWKRKTDLLLPNLAILLKHILAFYRSKETPDACPQLATMIEQLWEMKERIETHADVFKF